MDIAAKFTKAARDLKLQFHLKIELGSESQLPDETKAKVNELLAEIPHKRPLESQ